MLARPLVGVQTGDSKAKVEQHVTLPAVFTVPIRPDLVQDVHTRMAKNKRQPYAVSKFAGHQSSAESWGTGRAVARIPRVSGGGTHRAGQGAFGNMCRGGRMFAPTKTWRRWHRKINTTEKRHAVASAIAATAVPALVMARGHRVQNVPEIPLIVDNKAIDNVDKTAKAVALLKALGAYADVEKAKASVHIRRGQGKMRNRRYTQRRGPLIIFNEKGAISKAFRNLPGIEIVSVNRLNLLQLAPGGHLGRFCIWTKDAFEKLDTIFGTYKSSSQVKTDYVLPRSIISNPDLGRIINSDEVQTQLRDKIVRRKGFTKHKNPFNNLGALIKLNPYAKTLRRRELLAKEARDKKKAELLDAKRKGTVAKPTPAAVKAKQQEKKVAKMVTKTHQKFKNTLFSK